MIESKASSIKIGTSGYAYPDWVEAFYPVGLPKGKWLEFYAEHFDFCELNFSYYRMPTEKQMENFLKYPLSFAIKAHKSLTHDRVETPQARQDFLRSVKILDEEDHLGAVLLQFPYSFSYTPENRKYLWNLLEDLVTLPLVVEFRHPGWIRDSVFLELKQKGWGISMLDSPKLKGGMPPYEAVTSDIAYLRFHGRNDENWWKGDNVSRYDYEYSQEELEEWLPRITDMARLAKTTYVSFNNHARGQAIKNANQMTDILKKANLLPA
ncbi:MAG: DUF72 domain-containing protein [Candidatus Marinimicrobia bacterium]|nr:DUF72 domain-containing protein [Candidatus Neomarinimicrobiota bacterium]